MTNAHVVANGKYITVQKDGDEKPVIAKVKFIAHDSDLALLEVRDDSYFNDVKALEFGSIPKVREAVVTVGYPKGGEQISFTEGIVSRIGYRRYAHPGFDKHLLIQVDSAINSGNSGGPVMMADKVVGVAFQSYVNAENTGYIIPTPVINHFLDDIKDGDYDGHPYMNLHFIKGALENDGTKRYLGLKKDESGVFLGSISKASPVFEKLKKDDVLLSINNHRIGTDGKVELYGERVDYRVIYDLLQYGEEVQIKVLRDKKKIDVTFKVEKEGGYDPNNSFSLKPRYLVYGGIVFEALNRDLLKAWGKSWYYKAPSYLRYIHIYHDAMKELNSRKDIIVLVGFLPGKMHAWSSENEMAVLLKYNGKDVDSLENLKALLEAEKEKFSRFDFLYGITPLILPTQMMKEENELLLKKYNISQSYWFGSKNNDGATSNWR